MSQALDIYLYMGSYDKVIEILEQNGCKTEQQAIMMLRGSVQSNVIGVMSHRGGSLAGTANGSTKVIEYFREKERKAIEKAEAKAKR